jgi:hypothetical protein
MDGGSFPRMSRFFLDFRNAIGIESNFKCGWHAVLVAQASACAT